jgi:pantoate kinase
MMILFALYVRSVPPRGTKSILDLSKGPAPPDFVEMSGDSPETVPMVKEALDEAAEAILEAQNKEAEEETMEL